jgi:S-layer homology domain.
MKNLKKILSLSLAVVMLLGVMIFPASAADSKMTYADLVDKGDITNIDEVALLVDLGIIEGKPGGVYDPTGIVDRATMAKLVTTLLLNNADAAQFLGTTSDLTDIGGNWAEGFILYCYTQNVIAGDGMGNFFPTNQVTVAEAAKMLLVTLGYDANKAGLVGTDWAVNTISLASSVGVLSGVNLRSTDKLDRDNLALMMYNTLFTNQVAYNTLFGNEPISKNNTLGLGTYGLIKVTGLVNTATDKEITFVSGTVATAPQHNGANLAITSVKLGGQQAFIGDYVNAYVQVKTTTQAGNGLNLAATVVPTKDILKVYSSELTLADVDVVVSVDGTNLYKLAWDRGATMKLNLTASTNPDVPATKFYLNDDLVANFAGTAGSLATLPDWTATGLKAYYDSTVTADKNNALLNAIEKKGSIVMATDVDGDGYMDVVYVTVFTGATVTRVTDKEVTFSVNFGVTASNRKFDVEDISYDGDLKVDDIIYGYATPEGKLVLQATTTVDAKVRSSKSGEFVADGTTYKHAGSYITVNGYGYVPGDEVTIYLDANGFVVAATELEGVKNVAYVMAANNLPNVGNQTVKLLFVDGTNKVITASETFDIAGDKCTVALGNEIVGGDLVYYTEKTDGTYKLSIVKLANTAIVGNITNKETLVGVTTVTSATTFVNGDSSKVYTGFNAVPTTTVSAGQGAIYCKDTGVATYVFIYTGSIATTTKDIFVVSKIAKTDYVDSVVGVLVITAEGDAKEVLMHTSAYTTITSNGPGVYFGTAGSETDDGDFYYTTISQITEARETTGDETTTSTTHKTFYTEADYAVICANNVIQNSSSDRYIIDDNTVFVAIEETATGSGVYAQATVSAMNDVVVDTTTPTDSSVIQIIGTNDKDPNGNTAKIVLIITVKP